MKTASAGLDAHLQQEVTSLAVCWRLTRQDGTKFHFTEHDQDLDIDLDGSGVATYKSSSSFNSSAIKSDDTLSVDNLDLTGVLSATDVDETELRLGLFDYASIEIFIVNWDDLTQGVLKLRKGRIGEVTVTANGIFFSELRGLTQSFSRKIGRQVSTICDAHLGDSRCKIPIQPDIVQRNTAYIVGDFIRTTSDGTPATNSFDYDNRIYICTVAGTTAGSSPTYDTTVGNSTVDGTATFQAQEAWSRAIQVSAVDGSEPRKIFTVTELTPNTGSTAGRNGFPNDSMNGGAVIWESGNNAGRAMEVRDFIADDGMTIEQDIELFQKMPFDIQVGDVARIYRGCDKSKVVCDTIFDNIVNRRAYDYVPGQDAITKYPDAKS